MKKDVNRKQYELEFKQNAVKLTEKIGTVSTAECWWAFTMRLCSIPGVMSESFTITTT